MPLLGNAEKAELEQVILQRLSSRYEKLGPESILIDGLRVVARGGGVELDLGETPDPLAAVEVRTLFTALLYVSAGTAALPRDALATLASEATTTLANQINRIAPR